MAAALPSRDPAPDPMAAGDRRPSLSRGVRFAIFFGVLFVLKNGLPYTGLSATVQVLALAAAATLLVGSLWWARGENRRGGAILIALIWLASFARIIVQQ